MDDDNLADEQVVLSQNIEFSSTRLVDTLSEMEEPCIEFARGITVLDVLTGVIRFDLCNLGVDVVLAEVVEFDIAR